MFSKQLHYNLHYIVIFILVIIIGVQYKIINKRNTLQSVVPFTRNQFDEVTSPTFDSTVNLHNNDTNHRKLVSNSNENFIKPIKYSGVAVTLFLGSPKWFQNRYTIMINQVYVTLPSDWIIQIFYNPYNKMALEGTKYIGIQKLIKLGKVILTPLPMKLKNIKKKNLLKHQWLWKNIIADHVLLFGGTSAICANSPYELKEFASFDYIGAPWHNFNGVGGSGDISVRNRLKVLSTLELLEEDALDSKNVREDVNLVRTMTEPFETSSNSIISNRVVIANKEDTTRFAMTNSIAVGTPFSGTGTLSSFTDEVRQKYLDYCPEMKMMFPSLHNPNCFGADNSPEECFKYLCISSGLHCHERNSSIIFKSKGNKIVKITLSTL